MAAEALFGDRPGVRKATRHRDGDLFLPPARSRRRRLRHLRRCHRRGRDRRQPASCPPSSPAARAGRRRRTRAIWASMSRSRWGPSARQRSSSVGAARAASSSAVTHPAVAATDRRTVRPRAVTRGSGRRDTAASLGLLGGGHDLDRHHPRARCARAAGAPARRPHRRRAGPRPLGVVERARRAGRAARGSPTTPGPGRPRRGGRSLPALGGSPGSLGAPAPLRRAARGRPR